MANDLTRSRSSRSRRNWAESFRDRSDVFGYSRVTEDGDDEENLKWAALEKLPTYDRMRKGILRQVVDNGSVVTDEVDFNKLGLQDRKRLLDHIFKAVEEDNDRFLTRLRDRIDRWVSDT